MKFNFLTQLKNRITKYQLSRLPNISIAESAKVNYLGIRARPPTSLSIGRGSIFEGTIASDRTGSAVVIGNNTSIGCSTIVCADRVEIGDDVLISWGCTIVDHDSHSLSWNERSDDVKNWYRNIKYWDHVVIRPVKICNKVWIGFNVIVLKGVTIGEGAVVGAGSVVTKDVPPFTLVAGNPARVIRSIANGTS